MARLGALILILVMAAGRAWALEPRVAAELRRGAALVGSRTSDEPALRLERQAREPSAGFAVGSALAAWANAAEALDYILKTPSGDGDDASAIAEDCFDEKTAFQHLEQRRQALGMTPEQVLDAAGDGARLPAWRARQAGAPKACG